MHDILIVDDQPDIRRTLSGILEDDGYVVRTAADPATAWSALQARIPNLLILDIWLRSGEHDGLEILRKFAPAHPMTPVIMISGHANIETAVQAMKEGAYDFIEKPLQSDKVLFIVSRAMEFA